MALLDNVKMLNDLTDSERNQLEAFCQEKKLTTGEKLFEEWADANAMYILKEWEIEISKNINGKTVVLWLVEAEDLLWEMAIFSDNGKRMAGAKATKDTTLVTILSFSIQQIMNTKPELLEKMKGLIEQRMYENKMTQSKIS